MSTQLVHHQTDTVLNYGHNKRNMLFFAVCITKIRIFIRMKALKIKYDTCAYIHTTFGLHKFPQQMLNKAWDDDDDDADNNSIKRYEHSVRYHRASLLHSLLSRWWRRWINNKCTYCSIIAWTFRIYGAFEWRCVKNAVVVRACRAHIGSESSRHSLFIFYIILVSFFGAI